MKDRIKRLLEDKNGGNQSELARFAKVTPQAVQKWIAGTSEPKGKNLQKAAEFFGVTPSHLKFGAQTGEASITEKGESKRVESELQRVLREASDELELLTVYKLANPVERQTIDNAVSIVKASIDQRTGKDDDFRRSS